MGPALDEHKPPDVKIPVLRIEFDVRAVELCYAMSFIRKLCSLLTQDNVCKNSERTLWTMCKVCGPYVVDILNVENYI